MVAHMSIKIIPHGGRMAIIYTPIKKAMAIGIFLDRIIARMGKSQSS
jgi:hypothetical protein